MGEFNFGRVTTLMMALCILGFALQQFFDLTEFYFSYEYPSKPWVLITSMFLHANLVHLAYNLYSLFIFGNVLEKNTSSKFALITILSGGIIGNLAFSVFSSSRAIGFSGAVYALIGTVTVLRPNLKIPMPFGIIVVPAKAWFAGPVIALGELVLSVASFDNVAHAAHFGGFVLGFVTGLVNRVKTRKVAV